MGEPPRHLTNRDAESTLDTSRRRELGHDVRVK
uniref:Uncharacterized protein n=1 Tax=Physcomitrium patens TaxID=3218 RepID=A0A2K1IQ68_PHYPA|nr:hypothetical protein PHYPA_025550 [Physcomitrium patens]